MVKQMFGVYSLLACLVVASAAGCQAEVSSSSSGAASGTSGDAGSGGSQSSASQAAGGAGGDRATLVDAGGAPAPIPSEGGAPDTGGGAGGATSEPAPLGKLVHPGILSTAEELAAVAAHIAQGDSPWKEAFEDLESSTYAAIDYEPTPYAVVECGSYNMPNIGCTEQVEDGMAVYTHALLWYLTREQSHADKAIEIIDAWSSTYQENTDSNARLVVAWAVPWFANGAELLRYSNAGWSESSIEQFAGMLNTMLPYVAVVDGRAERPENNWMQSRIEAHLAIAVFLDDPPMLETALARWSFWLPYYIYQQTDGATPLQLPDRTLTQTLNIWSSSSYVDGLAMETCRDLGHLGLGFGSMIYAAETAWHQGIDLFAPNQKRLSDFMELHGAWMTGASAVPADICAGVIKAAQGDAQGISPPNGGGRKVWEVAYHELHDRLGLSLPFTREMIDSGRPAGAAHWVQKWETLTHAAEP